MVTNLAGGLVDAGFDVDLVLAKARGEHLAAIPSRVRIIRLGSRHTLTSLPPLIRYLRQQQPDALLAAKDRAIKVAVIARRLAGTSPRLTGRLGTTVSAALEESSWLKKQFWYAGMRLFYLGVDQIVAVSEGVANDVKTITGLPNERVQVVRNPVITPHLTELSLAETPHPWLLDNRVPVILAAGRLTRQKDFPTLLRAFALLHSSRPCRLIILGEGADHHPLETLAEQLRITEDFALPGFSTNPYAWIGRASLFVLSSAWEGSPNVLTEALALGIPSVATDCPSGPREILQQGRYGKLVPVGDVSALAQAMEQTLENPLPKQILQQAVEDYTVSTSVQGYLNALGLTADNSQHNDAAL
ncbi:MAG TPA: glycosyltransferase [Gammaproteobacteria bacterium]|nr:glycosyltransferase [Gammaproteobacteria bacterium]